MKRIMISQILKNNSLNKDYAVSGWVRTKRGSKHVAFIMLNDGSCLNDIQIIIEDEKLLNSTVNTISTGTSISVLGTLTKSKGQGQKVELIAKEKP